MKCLTACRYEVILKKYKSRNNSFQGEKTMKTYEKPSIEIIEYTQPITTDGEVIGGGGISGEGDGTSTATGIGDF